MNKILVTVGFIGANVGKCLFKELSGTTSVGIDNMNVPTTMSR